MLTEQIITHEELLEAVHEAAVQYVEAENALKNYRLALYDLTPERDAKLKELKRASAQRSQALREAQTKLLLSNRSL